MVIVTLCHIYTPMPVPLSPNLVAWRHVKSHFSPDSKTGGLKPKPSWSVGKAIIFATQRSPICMGAIYIYINIALYTNIMFTMVCQLSGSTPQFLFKGPYEVDNGSQ